MASDAPRSTIRLTSLPAPRCVPCADLNIAFNIWIWSEFFVLLLNKRRRAIHDFIAETVVISTLPEKQPAPNHENIPLTAS